VAPKGRIKTNAAQNNRTFDIFVKNFARTIIPKINHQLEKPVFKASNDFRQLFSSFACNHFIILKLYQQCMKFELIEN